MARMGGLLERIAEVVNNRANTTKSTSNNSQPTSNFPFPLLAFIIPTSALRHASRSARTPTETEEPVEYAITGATQVVTPLSRVQTASATRQNIRLPKEFPIEGLASVRPDQNERVGRSASENRGRLNTAEQRNNLSRRRIAAGQSRQGRCAGQWIEAVTTAVQPSAPCLARTTTPPQYTRVAHPQVLPPPAQTAPSSEEQSTAWRRQQMEEDRPPAYAPRDIPPPYTEHDSMTPWRTSNARTYSSSQDNLEPRGVLTSTEQWRAYNPRDASFRDSLHGSFGRPGIVGHRLTLTRSHRSSLQQVERPEGSLRLGRDHGVARAGKATR